VIAYIARRLGALAGVLLVICAVTFAIFFVFPANPAQQVCGKNCTPARVAVIRHQFGLDESLPEQFGKYVVGIVDGRTYGSGDNVARCPAPCLGFSYQSNTPVTKLIEQRLPVSASLAIGAGVLWLASGVLIGVVSALRKDTWIDRTIMMAALGGMAMPTFLLGILLLLVMCTRLDVLPYPAYTSVFQDPVGFVRGMILPWATLATGYAAVYARFTRASMIETMGQDFITTARAKGLREHTVVIRHGLRAGLTPIMTIFGMDLGALLGGSIIAEQVFGMPGLGTLVMQSVDVVDIPVVMGITLLAAFFVVFANLVVDVLYGVVDPKVRLR